MSIHAAPAGPLVVVLTGGIASGKTAVSDLFAERGVPVIDTDVIAHEVVEPGESVLQEIAQAFGPHVLDAQGHLDRRQVRNAIFSDPHKKRTLEALLHPLIRQRVTKRIGEIQAPYCILVVPLFAETGFYPARHRVLVVDVAEETQLQRVMARDRIDRAQAEAILNAQANRQQRLALADDIITNDGPLSALETHVDTLHQKYLELAEPSALQSQ